MINQLFIREKLDKIKVYYQELEDILKYSLKEIKADHIKYHAAERLLQLIVDEMLDVNNHLILKLDLESPDDFQSTFKILAEGKILPEEFAQKIAPVVGLRNRLVHRYEKIDLDFTIKQIIKEKEDFKKYCLLIEKYISKIK